MAAFTHCEGQALFHSDRLDQLNAEGSVIARLHHLNAFRQGDDAGDVGGTEVELRTVVGEERRVTAAFVLGQHVDFALELGVRGHGARSSQNLTTLDLVTVDAAEQQTGVVASLALVHLLVEGLDGGDGGGLGRTDADDLDVGVDRELTTLDTAGHHGATAGDGEDIFDRHQERLVQIVDRGRDVVIDGVHELLDLLNPLLVVRSVIVQCAVSGHVDDRAIAIEAVFVEEVTDLFLNELDELVVVDHIQIMNAIKPSDSRQQEITEISRGLKMIAKELDIPVIALSQLSRLVTGRKGQKPVLSDLRESGAIEQDADIVMFIHRPDLAAEEKELEQGKVKKNVAQIIIAKNRAGECRDFDLLFKGEKSKFINPPASYINDIQAPGERIRKNDFNKISDGDIPAATDDDAPLEGDDNFGDVF